MPKTRKDMLAEVQAQQQRNRERFGGQPPTGESPQPPAEAAPAATEPSRGNGSAPSDTPPATDQPPVPPASAPETPPAQPTSTEPVPREDYEAVKKELEEQRRRGEEAFRNMRSTLQQQLDAQQRELRLLREKNEELERRVTAPPSPPPGPAPAEPRPNGSPSEHSIGTPSFNPERLDADGRQALEKLKDLYGDDAVQALQGYFGSQWSQTMATMFEEAKAAGRREAESVLSPQLNRITENLEEQRRREAAEQADQNAREFDRQMRERGFPDYEQLFSSQDFMDWLLKQPMANEYYRMCYPEPGEQGGSVSQICKIFSEYRQADPRMRDNEARQRENEERRRAAAESVHQPPTSRSMLPTGGEGDILRESDIRRRMQAAHNNPKEVIALRKEIAKAREEGRFVPDLSGGGFAQGPPMP